MLNVQVVLPSGKKINIPYGTRVSQALAMDQGEKYPDSGIIAVLVNNVIVSLSYKIEVNSTIIPVTQDSPRGSMVYRRSLCFILAMAAKKLFPNKRLLIGHSLGDGYYYTFDDNKIPSLEDLNSLTSAMNEIISQNLAIVRSVISYSDAIDYFKKNNQPDTCRLLAYRNESKIPVYMCEDFIDISHEPMAASTGIINCFQLHPYQLGFLMRYPTAKNPSCIEEFKDYPLLFSIYQERKDWGKILKVNCVGALNEKVHQGQIKEFIAVAEALQNKKISEIADKIHQKSRTVKAVLIAGPSSSGKTTFTKKLAIQLQVMGLLPELISLDDYFLPRDRTPRDEHGNYDFERLDALDIEQLNEDLLHLFKGEEVELPIFDFKIGNKKPIGRKLTLSDRSILVMEGIHGLNDALTPLIPKETKYKVYVSALTQLNLDDHNRIPTTDNRLLRRMVRDYQFRGKDAAGTIDMWSSVRRGEEQNIFPFQNMADAAFNSALDYELGVLKIYAEPLLRMVKPGQEAYTEAVRLQNFLDNFMPISTKHIPFDSILREFIGDSGFKY